MGSAVPTTRVPRWGLTQLGRVLALGLIVREAFSFWTGHPYDFEVWLRTGHAIASGANPYVMPWPAVPGVSFAFPGQSLPSAAYLPFWPYLAGGIFRLWEGIGGGNRFVLYFLMKQPGILADVLTAYLLYGIVARWTRDPARALAAASFWAFFPYAILITAIWGQFDSIPVAIILGVFWASGPLERNLLWGFGILVKWVTAIFLPLEIFRERGSRRLTFGVAGALSVGATLLAFWASGWSLSHLTAGAVSQTHGAGYGMNLALLFSIPPGSNWVPVYPYLFAGLSWLYIPGVFLAGWVGARGLRAGEPGTELRAYLLIVGVFLLLRWGLYEQYLLYLFSLLWLDVVVFHPGRRTLLFVTIGLALTDLLVNNDFGYRFLGPLNAGIWGNVVFYDNYTLYGTVRTWALVVLAFAVVTTLVQLIWSVLREQPDPFPWILAWVPPLARRMRHSSPP